MALKINELPPLDELARLFERANEGSGLRWKIDRGTRKLAGKLAGHTWTDPRDKKRYWRVTVGGKAFLVHRIIWALYNSEIPPPEIEIGHLDGDGLNNQLGNLKIITRDFSFHALSRTWVATITLDSKRIHLGYHKTFLKAATAHRIGEELFANGMHKEFRFMEMAGG